MYIFRLAWRYATSRWFNLIAVLVMALTLMASLTVLGVIDGMMIDMERRIRDLGEQVTVYFERPVPQAALAEMPRVAGVKGYTPQIINYALIAKNNFAAEPAIAYGIDLAAEMQFSALATHLENFALDAADPRWLPPDVRGDLPGLFIGKMLAEKIDAYPGDVVTLSFAPTGVNELRRRDFYVTSVFSTGSMIKDENGVYLPLDAAREMFLSPVEAREGAVTTLSFFLDEPDAVNQELKMKIARAAVDATHVSARAATWKERWRSIYEGMAYENMLMEVVLFFMNLMAGCSVFAVMATLVSRKVRDVGLLRCLGASRIHTVGVFIVVGLLIGAAGAFLGVAAGYAVGLNINELWKIFTGMELYPPRMFGHTITPVIHAHKVAVYGAAAILISAVSALYPAFSAGLREPLAALRDE
ncbi:MAG: ABC transporter permease [Planctomycetota bacterium]|jgi:ABC-type lipoprotein release transport system permease subunit|nr:ABC transporter permease [Planctomycetota bacterium]